MYLIRTSSLYTSTVGTEFLLQLAINNYIITREHVDYLIYTILCYLGVLTGTLLFISLFFIKSFDTLNLATSVITRGIFSLHILTVYYACVFYI